MDMLAGVTSGGVSPQPFEQHISKSKAMIGKTLVTFHFI
jgi:hypothetical protein